MKQKMLVTMIGLAFMLACTVACHKSPNIVRGPNAYDNVQGGKLIVNNWWFSRKIELVEAETRPDQNSLQAIVHLRNRTRSTVPFECQWRWFTEEGVQIDPLKAHWTPVQIAGGDDMRLQSIAPHAEAVRFDLLIRSPQAITK